MLRWQYRDRLSLINMAKGIQIMRNYMNKYAIALAALSITNYASANEDSNNPFSKVLYFKHEYTEPLKQVGPDADSSNYGSGSILQVGKGLGNWLVRATLPVVQSSNHQSSAIGDLNLLIPRAWTFDNDVIVGAGLNITLPTHTENYAGSDSVGLGFGIGYMDPVKGSAFSHSGLLTYINSVDDNSSLDQVHKLEYTPFLYWTLNDGVYLRSTAPIKFDFVEQEYNIPIGIGVGKIVDLQSSSFNFYGEFQRSLFYKGNSIDAFNLMLGLKIDFKS
ncbi:hypothetical protein [Vibrio mediterranei]|uniref:hypothetical protein n=1 Tax=Vibrio mediterranei TaxID=689 RepID=UPI0015E72241|nr:hypothetical protein [Vibrio mediterranei]